MPEQMAWSTAPGDTVWVSRDETRRSSSSPRRWSAALAASCARCTARAAWRTTSVSTSRSSSVGRMPLSGEPTLRMPSIVPSAWWNGTKISSSACQASGASTASISATIRLPDCVSQSSSPS